MEGSSGSSGRPAGRPVLLAGNGLTRAKAGRPKSAVLVLVLPSRPCVLQRGFAPDWLGNTFSQAVFLGNGLMAILSGLAAHLLVETAALGPVAPFDAAATGALRSRGFGLGVGGGQSGSTPPLSSCRQALRCGGM